MAWVAVYRKDGDAMWEFAPRCKDDDAEAFSHALCMGSAGVAVLAFSDKTLAVAVGMRTEVAVVAWDRTLDDEPPKVVQVYDAVTPLFARGLAAVPGMLLVSSYFNADHGQGDVVALDVDDSGRLVGDKYCVRKELTVPKLVAAGNGVMCVVSVDAVHVFSVPPACKLQHVIALPSYGTDVASALMHGSFLYIHFVDYGVVTLNWRTGVTLASRLTFAEAVAVVPVLEGAGDVKFVYCGV